MGHRLELVVDEELRQHEEEAERVDAVHHALDAPRVPAAAAAGAAGGGRIKDTVPVTITSDQELRIT